MTSINEQAKVKNGPEPTCRISKEFDKIFSNTTENEPKCKEHCGCKSSLPETGGMLSKYCKPYAFQHPCLTPEQQRTFEQKFQSLFGPENNQKVKKVAKKALTKTHNELDFLYEQIFGKNS
jgi:hypothetical protein